MGKTYHIGLDIYGRYATIVFDDKEKAMIKKYMSKIPFSIQYTENGKIQILEPKYRIGDSVRYIATECTKFDIVEVRAISYVEQMRKFEYWVTNYDHPIAEEFLIVGDDNDDYSASCCQKCKFSSKDIVPNKRDTDSGYMCILSKYKVIKERDWDSINSRPVWCRIKNY